eukprot:6186823-Pleurochrysis_carterae.AAC.3
MAVSGGKALFVPPTFDLVVRIKRALSSELLEFDTRTFVAMIDVLTQVFLASLEHAAALVEGAHGRFEAGHVVFVVVRPDVFKGHVLYTGLGGARVGPLRRSVGR